MDSGQATGLFLLLSVFISLVINILSYRLIFRKKKRARANLFSWLLTLGIMVPIILSLMTSLTKGVTGGLGLIGWGLLMMVVFTPTFWFVPPGIYTAIRAIIIVSTKKREREILSDSVKASEQPFLER